MTYFKAKHFGIFHPKFGAAKACLATRHATTIFGDNATRSTPFLASMRHETRLFCHNLTCNNHLKRKATHFCLVCEVNPAGIHSQTPIVRHVRSHENRQDTLHGTGRGGEGGGGEGEREGGEGPSGDMRR